MGLLGRGAIVLAGIGLIGFTAFLFFPHRIVTISGEIGTVSPPAAAVPNSTSTGEKMASSTVPNASGASSSASSSTPAPTPPGSKTISNDLPSQPHLPNPPEIVKGIYLTNWTAGYAKHLDALVDLVDKTELNAMVIDIKDYSGYIAYRTGLPDFVSSGAEKDIRILQPNALIKKLHDRGIYVIGRVSVFQDPVLAKSHPEWAVKNKNTGELWTDRKGISWMDAGAEPVWAYHVALAKDAFARGFDEINFDYIRFPSDGDLSLIAYPYTGEGVSEHKTIAKFFAYLRKNLPGEKISVDLFGLTTSSADDLGIGQKIEDAYPNFDYVSPMVYPSHFASGYNGFKNPAEHPYDVIKVSMQAALGKLDAFVKSKEPVINGSSTSSSTVSSTEPIVTSPPPLAMSSPPLAKLRPWLQSFNLGAVYDAAKIQAQIQAAEEVLGVTSHYAGWLLWDPTNNYRSYK